MTFSSVLGQPMYSQQVLSCPLLSLFPSTATALRDMSLAGHTSLSPCLSHAQSLLGTGYGTCGHLFGLTSKDLPKDPFNSG